jgi:hypothetical protein
MFYSVLRGSFSTTEVAQTFYALLGTEKVL